MTDMTLDQFIARAKELRAAADTAERELMEFLRAAEQQPSIWKGTGLTFPEVVERFNICKAIRYEAYKRMNAAHTVDELAVGMNAIVAADKLKSGGAQSEVLAEAKKWEEANGTSISEQSAARIARDTKQREAAGRTRHRSYTSLVEENARLQRDLEVARTKIAALRVELKKAQQSARKGVRKRSSGAGTSTVA